MYVGDSFLSNKSRTPHPTTVGWGCSITVVVYQNQYTKITLFLIFVPADYSQTIIVLLTLLTFHPRPTAVNFLTIITDCVRSYPIIISTSLLEFTVRIFYGRIFRNRFNPLILFILSRLSPDFITFCIRRFFPAYSKFIFLFIGNTRNLCSFWSHFNGCYFAVITPYDNSVLFRDSGTYLKTKGVSISKCFCIGFRAVIYGRA